MSIIKLVLLFPAICLATIASADSIPTIKIDEVVVTGTRGESDARLLPMTVSVLNRNTIENRHEQSLLPILSEQVPGLFLTNRGIMGFGISTGGSGAITVRGIGGSPSTGVLVLVDGHPQFSGLMGHSIADSYQSMLAERVEVVRGPASVLYGSNAMGGVINIITRKQKTNGINTGLSAAYGSFNTLTTEFMNAVRKNKFSSVVTASYNRTDGHRSDLGFEQFGGLAKVGYDFSRNWKATIDANISHFNSSNPGPVSSPLLDNDSHITRGIASASLNNEYSNTSGAINLFYNWGRHKINDGYASSASPKDYLFHSRDNLMGISVYQNFSAFQGNRITLGVDYQHSGGDAWNEYNSDGHRTYSADTTINEVAGYIDIRQHLLSVLTLDAGVRVDNHSTTGTQWIPQGGVSLVLPHQAEMRAMVSKGFRNPSLRELFMFRSKNPALLPESIMNYELSYSQWLLYDKLHYSANLFLIDGKNLIQTAIVNGSPMNINSGEVHNWGVELEAAYTIDKKWTVNANYSFLKMRNPILASPKHKLYVEGNYRNGRWNASSGVQYVSGLYTSLSDDNEENFLLWNIRIDFSVSKVLSLFAKGENLLAQCYEINAGFPMPRATMMAGFNIKFNN